MKEFQVSERFDKNFGEMSKLMSDMSQEELKELKLKTEQAYKITGGDYMIHSLQIALINSHLKP